MVENGTTTNLKKLVLEVEKTYKNGNTDGKIAVTLKNPSATEKVTITTSDVVTLSVTVYGSTVDTEISMVAKIKLAPPGPNGPRARKGPGPFCLLPFCLLARFVSPPGANR